jgi:DMSO/TMAO reductase YedYZ heme-binding membrane subunit
MNPSEANDSPSTTPLSAVVLAWLLVTVPLLWGVWQTIKKASALFQ